MLTRFTSITDFLGTSIALWLGTYLFARGFTSRVTQRAVVILLALALSFFVSYVNLYQPLANIGAWWAALYTIALVAWYDLTYQLVPPPIQRKTVWVAWGVYLLGLLKIILLVGFRDVFPTGSASTLWIISGNATPLSLADSAFLLLTASAIVYNFRVGAQSAIGPHSHSTWIATLLGAGSIGYGVLALVTRVQFPRVIQDGLLVAALSALGVAITIHQALVERRAVLRDLPVSGLSIFGFAGLYAGYALQQGDTAIQIAGLAWLAILTHSVYDMVRVFLDDRLHRSETELRQQLRQLAHEVDGPGALQPRLQQGLHSLCHTLGAVHGFIAVREADQFIVRASVGSLEPGDRLDLADVAARDLTQPPTARLGQVAWLAPVFVSGEQLAVIALGPRRNRGQYSDTDFDLLAETADRVGLLVTVHAQQSQSREKLEQLTAEMKVREVDLQGAAEGLVTAIQSQPDPALVREVETSLRNLADFTALGQSPLVSTLGLTRPTHIEGGKALRERLIQAINTLHPAGPRPGGVLPREWHCYAVLHDAYIEDVPNREIMARLYVSEGSFNRLRRKALIAVTRAVLELKNSPVVGSLL